MWRDNTAAALTFGKFQPIRLDKSEQTEEIVDALFPENPWLCVGKTSSYFVTLERERLRGLLNKDFTLIQPNPCKAQHGLTSDGRLSFHAETNVLERRYLIVEFDDAKGWNDSDALDSQAARLLHLRLYLPLVLVVFSGNKSCKVGLFAEITAKTT